MKVRSGFMVVLLGGLLLAVGAFVLLPALSKQKTSTANTANSAMFEQRVSSQYSCVAPGKVVVKTTSESNGGEVVSCSDGQGPVSNTGAVYQKLKAEGEQFNAG